MATRIDEADPSAGVGPSRPSYRPFPRRVGYSPGLDGLRALSVGAVLLYHSGYGWAQGGFLGVEVFFVISGYLITSLLLAEWRISGDINLPAFWGRRARRLLPALFLMLGVVSLVERAVPSRRLATAPR